MATNNIKPFATDSGANVLTDTALASRSELQTGFPLKSKADSALIGKLMQNATAGAYAVGQFSAKYGTTDITGSDATGFATAFESALQAYVNEKAPTPDLTSYLTKLEASTTYQLAGDYATVAQLSAKADASALTSYAPLANPALTGTATLNGQNIATVNQIPDTSHFVTDTTIQGYAPLAGAAFTGAITVQEPTTASNPATKQYVDSAVSSVLKYKGTVANQSALPSSDQAIGDVWTTQDSNKEFAWDGTKWIELGPTIDLSGYLTTESATATYLSKTDAQSTYQPKGDYATNTALTQGLAGKADASALANYAPLANPAFTGTATLGGQTIATVNQIPDIKSYVKYAGDAEHNEVLLDLSESNNPEGNKNLRIQVMTSTGEPSEAIECAPITNPSFQENAYIDGNAIATEYYANNAASTKISITGQRGVLAGYETTADVNNALTITSSSPDSQRATAAIAITVPAGNGEESWVKKVFIQEETTTISLGDNWFWVGGSQPTVTAPSLLVLSWDSVAGMAILNTTG